MARILITGRPKDSAGPIARLVGHTGTTVTELVDRHQLWPVIQAGATVKDRLFGVRSRAGP